MVGLDVIVTFSLGNLRGVSFPDVGKDLAGPVLVEPLQLLLSDEEYAPQNELGHRLWMLLRIGQGQSAAPRAAEHLPFFDVQMLAQRLHIIDEVPGRVFL